MGGKARKILAMGLSLAIAMQPVISVNASDDILSAEDENTQDFYDGIDENEEIFIDETMPNESVEKESDEFVSVENNQESNLDDENIMVLGGSDNPISNFATYTYGDYEYSIDNGNVTIIKYIGTENIVTIPSVIDGYTVTTIGASAFAGCSSVVSITLPNKLETIGSLAFKGTQITYVKIPATVTSMRVYGVVNESAFTGCEKLETMEFENGITVIPRYGVTGITSLKKVILPSSVTKISEGAFYEDTSLMDVKFPKSLLEIGEEGFYGCSSLVNIALPQNMKTIGASAFSGCESLQNISFNKELTTIGASAFAGCSSVVSITLPNKLETIGSLAFKSTQITYVKIPATVTSMRVYGVVNESAFTGCEKLETMEFENGITVIPRYGVTGITSLKKVILPSSVTKISEGAFYEDTSLMDVKFPKSLLEIGEEGFYGCSSLVNIALPKNMKTIGVSAFSGCKSLQNISFNKELTTIGASAFSGCESLQNISFNKELTTIGASAFAGCSSVVSITLPNKLETIGSLAFKGTQITYVKIPATVTSMRVYGVVNESAFTGCEKLETMEFENGITVIPRYGVTGITSLKKVILPSSVTKISEGAFYEDTSLMDVKFPKSLLEIGEEGFYGCSSLVNIALPQNMKTIGASAFSGCKSLQNISFNKELTTIGASAFAGCSSVVSITLPNKLETIGSLAFKSTQITYVKIPATVTSMRVYGAVDESAFTGCEKLETMEFENGITVIPRYGVTGITSLKKVILPSSVTKISEGAFYEDASLTDVEFPESLQEIGDSAFARCAKLKVVQILKNVNSISTSTFAGCSDLTIYGYSGSYAETYAKSKNISFIALKDKKTIDISKAKISGVQEVYEYTGITIKPVPKVTLNNKQLTEKKDYNISYKKNKNIGTATITITGKGNYSGLRIIEFRIINMENNIEKSAVSFANIFAKKAKNTNSTTTNAKQQLEDLGNQLTITGYKGTLPDEVLEAFATAVLNTIKDSNIDKYETNQNKLANQIYAQIKGGLKSDSKKIILGNGSKKITYTVNYTIFAQSFGGIGAQVSWANVEWRDAKNKSYSVHIVANSKNENMKKTLASYCAVLAQLNKDVWKDFLTKYITDGWKLAGLNTVKKLDDKTVSKFFDRSEKLILTICGDQNAKKALVNDAGNTLKEKLLKMSKAQFRNFIKNNIPDGDKIIAAADQYKKVIDKYNDYKKKFNKWNKTRKDSDLAKYEKAYLECQELLEVLNDSLSKVS